MARVRRQTLALLRRVEAGLCDRFQLRDVCPTDAADHLGAFEGLIEHGYLERVTESVGKWYIRVTDAGRAVLAGAAKLQFGGE